MSRGIWWFALAISVAACKGEPVDAVAVDAGDAGSVGSDAGADAAPADSGADSTSSPADADAGPTELLKNVGFELGCAGWNGYNAKAEESSDARTGAKSCRVCSIEGAYDFGLWQAPTTAPEIGRTYVGEAWIRTEPGDAGVARDPHAALETWKSDVDPVVEVNNGPSVSLDASWKRVSALLTVTKGAATLRFAVRAYDGSTCFLIDDASLHPTP